MIPYMLENNTHKVADRIVSIDACIKVLSDMDFVAPEK